MSVEPQADLSPALQPTTSPRILALPRRVMRRLPSREGAFWVIFALIAPRVVGPVVTIGLRRFLGPGAAGLYDEAATPYNFLNNFRNFGTGPAIIYEKNVSRTVANTAWSLNMIFAVAVTLVAQIIARPVALYYGHPELESVFRVLSIAYVFASLTSVHSFLLLRDLDYRARSVPAVGQVIIAGDVAVLFAAWGFGVGALVAREITSVVMGTILLWAVYPFRPSLELVPSVAWKLLTYGVWVGMGLTVLYMSQNVDVFIGGHIIHSTSDIGFYTTSWKLSFIAAGALTLVATTMVFPSLSRLQDDLNALRQMLFKSIRQMGLLMFPAAIAVAAVAPSLIVPVLGEKYAPYRDSFIVLSLLAVYAGNRTMLSVFFEGYKSIGKPWIVFAYNVVKLAIMVPVMIIGAQRGIVGLAAAYIPVQILEIPAALYLANRVLKVSPLDVWKAAYVPLVSTLLMAGSIIAVELVLLGRAHVGDTPTLLASLLVGFVVYLGSLLLLDRRILHEARAVLLRGL